MSGERVGRVERRPIHTYRGLGCCDGDRGHLGVSLKLYIQYSSRCVQLFHWQSLLLLHHTVFSSLLHPHSTGFILLPLLLHFLHPYITPYSPTNFLNLTLACLPRRCLINLGAEDDFSRVFYFYSLCVSAVKESFKRVMRELQV